MSIQILEAVGEPSIRTIKIRSDENILVVEDRPDRVGWFRQRIPWCRTADLAHLANESILESLPDVIWLDYDLHHFTSEDTAALLAAIRFSGQIYIHSLNITGPQKLCSILCDLPHVSVTPFGDFKIQIVELERSKKMTEWSRTR